MLKKTIVYTNIEGEEITEELYFNLTKAEITEMHVNTPEGLDKYLEKIVNTGDTKELLNFVKTLITKSYGIKSEDGKKFLKSQKIVDEFLPSEAYSELFMDLITKEDAALEFINAVIPPLSEEEQKLADEKKAVFQATLDNKEANDAGNNGN